MVLLLHPPGPDVGLDLGNSAKLLDDEFFSKVQRLSSRPASWGKIMVRLAAHAMGGMGSTRNLYGHRCSSWVADLNFLPPSGGELIDG